MRFRVRAWYNKRMAKYRFTTKRKKSRPTQTIAPQPNAEIEAARVRYSFLDENSEVEPDSGKIVYEYSSARTMFDLSDATKKRARTAPSSIYLLCVGVVMIAWVLFSLLYRLSTESNGGAVWLSMIPSLVFTAAAVAIVILSIVGMWGRFARFAIRHNLHGARGGFEKAQIYRLGRAFDAADAEKGAENALSVTHNTVSIWLYGYRHTYAIDDVIVRVRLENDRLHLTFSVGRAQKKAEIDFPELLAREDYYKLKKAFGDRLRTIRTHTEKEITYDEKGKRLYAGDTFGSVVAGAILSCVVLAAGVMLTITHYLWVPSIPPFLGVFFAMMSMLAFGNTFSHVPAVSYIMIPLAFSLVLLVVPPWIFVWYETELAHNALTLWGVLTHADAFPVGMFFFSCLGGYVFVFAVCRIVEYVRFGKE